MEKDDIIINVQDNQASYYDVGERNFLHNTGNPNYHRGLEVNARLPKLEYYYCIKSEQKQSKGNAVSMGKLYNQIEDSLKNDFKIKESNLKIILTTETISGELGYNAKVVDLEDFNYIKNRLSKEFVNVQGNFV